MTKKITDAVSIIKKYWLPKSKEVLYLSLIISYVLPLIICYFTYPKIMNKLPVYDDFIAGATTWSGYNKPGDLKMFYLYLIIYSFLIIFTPLFLNFIFHKKNLIIRREEDFFIKNPAQLFMFCFFIFCITLFILNKVIPLNLVIALISFYCVYYILSNITNKDTSSIFSSLCLISVFAYFSGIAGFVALEIIDKGKVSLLITRYNYIFVVIMLAVLFMSWAISKGIIKEKIIDTILFLSQIILPVLFLSFYKLRYTHGEDIVSPYYSQKLKYACLLMAVFMVIYNLYIFYRKYRKGAGGKQILITSVISISAFITFSIPSGSLLIDFFHNGEQTVPMQQLYQFGSIPFLDYFPIHGMMDYFNQFFNYIFFSGQYGTYNAASSTANILKTILICLLFRHFIKGEVFSFVLAVLCAGNIGYFTDRWFAVFIMMIILYSEKTRKDPIIFIWWWIVTSIFAIAWNPPLGGSAAVSFIPFAVYLFAGKDGITSLSQLKNKKYRDNIIIRWMPLILIGVLFIPMFINIARYTLDNAASTIYANGTSNTFAIINGAFRFFDNKKADAGLSLLIFPLGFTMITGLLLIILYNYRNSKIPVVFIILQIIILAGMVASYTFSRADNNLGRARNAAVVISIAVILTIGYQVITENKIGKFIILIPAIMGIAFNGRLFEQHKKIYSFPSIRAELVQFDGAEAGISNLGVVYADQAMVKHLVDINNVLDGAESFLDLTNNIAYDAIFGKKTPVPYSSIYNVYSRPMHYKYIGKIFSNPPELVLISPNIGTDGGSAAFRAYPVYRWLLQQGYEPFKYNDIVFLLSKNSFKRNLYEKADAELAVVMHKKDIGFLPVLWGSEKILGKRVVDGNIYPDIAGKHQIEESWITGNDSFIIYELKMPLRGIENDFIKVSLRSGYDLKNEDFFQIFWSDEGEEFSEEKSFVFKGYNGDLLIPVGTSPYWSQSNNIKNIRFDFSPSMAGKQVPDVEISIFKSLPVNIGKNIK
jgi:hypothetical protein